MRFSSRLMPGLAASLKTSVTSGPDSSTQSDIDVPNSILPVWALSKPVASSILTAAPVNAQESFVWSFSLSQPASQVATANFAAQFASGPWRIFIIYQMLADFISPIFGSPVQGHLLISDPVNVNGLSLASNYAHTSPQTIAMDIDIVFPVDGWRVGLGVDATGVSQNIQQSCGMIARRLI